MTPCLRRSCCLRTLPRYMLECPTCDSLKCPHALKICAGPNEDDASLCNLRPEGRCNNPDYMPPRDFNEGLAIIQCNFRRDIAEGRRILDPEEACRVAFLVRPLGYLEDDASDPGTTPTKRAGRRRRRRRTKK